jgi:hypothetical protein
MLGNGGLGSRRRRRVPSPDGLAEGPDEGVISLSRPWAWAAIWPASWALMCKSAVSLDDCWKLASAMSRFAPQAKSVTGLLGPVSAV